MPSTNLLFDLGFVLFRQLLHGLPGVRDSGNIRILVDVGGGGLGPADSGQ